MIHGKCCTTGRESSLYLISGYVRRVWIEDFFVQIFDNNFVPVFAQYCYVGLVAKINDFLVYAIFDENCEMFWIVIWNKINGSLNSIEITRSVSAHD